MIIGYTVGTFDLLHNGHVNFLEQCAERCDILLVAINVIGVGRPKPKPIMAAEHRLQMVRSLDVVHYAWIEPETDKMEAWIRHRFDKFFVGEDWKDTDHWKAIEAQFEGLGVEIVYLPYTQGISSSLIRKWCVDADSGKD